MPTGSGAIRRCGGSSAARRSGAAAHRPARWDGSRPSYLRATGTSPPLRTCRGCGSTGFMTTMGRSASVLDMDSSVSPTNGDQNGADYNGHFGCTC
jgi:hypothetical protein